VAGATCAGSATAPCGDRNSRHNRKMTAK
jgi:hypothetical protein